MPEPCYIPSKMLIHCADVMQTDQNATAFGIHAKFESIDRQFVVQPAFEKVYADAAMIKKGYRQSENVEVYKGHGRFTGPRILAAEGFDEELTAETILIAAGTLPWLPDIPSLDQSPYLTFDEPLGLPEQPKPRSVIGGGYIAAQSPHFFGALGTEVNIIHRRGQMGSEEDNDVARRFTKVYQRRHNMILDAQVKRVPAQGEEITVEVTTPDGKRPIPSDALLMAAGRVPNTDILEVAHTSVALNQRGYINTDKYLQASVPGIWARAILWGPTC